MRVPEKALLLLLLGGIAGCDPPPEVTAADQRVVTSREKEMRVDVSDDDRFGKSLRTPAMPTPEEVKPGGGRVVAAAVPPEWVAQPATSFRLLNYRAGDTVEVAVGVAKGGVLENVNRWLGQFGAEGLTAEGLAALPKLKLLGQEGVWIEASGDYSPGMGQAPRANQRLFGVIAADGEEIWTVKMTGSAEEMESQREALKAFVAGLKKP